MSSLEHFPKNVKQIGTADKRLRIYVEDYVHTYMNRYAATENNREKVAILIGKYIDGDEPALFISGLIQGKFSKSEKGIETFTNETWDYVHKTIEEYFEGFYIVGWAHTQPAYGTFLIPSCEKYHLNLFPKAYQVLYILDHMELQSAFYIYDEKKERLVEAAGYFIYYDRNEYMHEYMLKNDLTQLNAMNETPEIIFDGININTEPAPDLTAIVSPEEREELEGTAKSKKEKKRHSTKDFMGTLSASLFFVCFIMGATLLYNGNRLDKLEEELAFLYTRYNIITNSLTQNTQPVFANDEIHENNEVPEASQVITTMPENQESPPETVPTPEPEAPPVQTPAETPTAQPQAEETTAPAAQNPEIYVVQLGDTLSSISLKIYGTQSSAMMQKILDANGMTDPNKLVEGQKLILPPGLDN